MQDQNQDRARQDQEQHRNPTHMIKTNTETLGLKIDLRPHDEHQDIGKFVSRAPRLQ